MNRVPLADAQQANFGSGTQMGGTPNMKQVGQRSPELSECKYGAQNNEHSRQYNFSHHLTLDTQNSKRMISVIVIVQ